VVKDGGREGGGIEREIWREGETETWQEASETESEPASEIAIVPFMFCKCLQQIMIQLLSIMPAGELGLH